MDLADASLTEGSYLRGHGEHIGGYDQAFRVGGCAD